jgi:GLTT repeat (6 copies)
VPNRRRRQLSTAMSAVAALAVASPFAVSIFNAGKPAPEHQEFVQAALVTDLPGEIMSALQSSLSQFGVVVPNLPSGLTGSPSTPSALTTPGSLTTPGLTAPPATAAMPGTATMPGTAATPGVPDPASTTPGLTTPGLTTPGLTAPGLTDQALSNPALTNPTAPGAAPAGLTTPPVGTNPALTSPTGAVPGLTGVPGEVPISAPLGPDPATGTYPILGDPSLGALGSPAAAAPSGGLLGNLDSVVSQLGGTQAIDLLKGVVVPSIMQAIKGAVPGAPGAAAPAAAPTIPGVPGLPGLPTPAVPVSAPAPAPVQTVSAAMPAPPAIPANLAPGVTVPAH